MFIFNLTYVKPISDVEQFLPEHIQYLEKYYTSKKFICSGRKVPRTGGIILCNCATKQEAEQIIKEDPFFKENNIMGTFSLVKSPHLSYFILLLLYYSD